MPAHNEEDVIDTTLNSIINQTALPDKLVVVNDNSTDGTLEIVNSYIKTHKWIGAISLKSSDSHQPGPKVVNAFYKGLATLDNSYDIICKFDADIKLPENYIETITKTFLAKPTLGCCGGLLYVLKNNRWTYESISDKSHVRGPIKAYRKACFEAIGGIKSSVGWDTMDVLLARYYKWDVTTLPELGVCHLKPTGKQYSTKNKAAQGAALYKMRYGFVLTLITAVKLAITLGEPYLIISYTSGFINAKLDKLPFLVTNEEGKFIRNFRWKTILKKLSL